MGSRPSAIVTLDGRRRLHAAAPVARVQVLDGFELRLGADVHQVPRGAQRVLAFLAVRARPQPRTSVASALWMDTPDERAAANLRTALWKIRAAADGLVVPVGTALALGPAVEVDLVHVLAQAHRLIQPGEMLLEGDTPTDTFVGDLLPGWDEDWLLFDRERVRQLCVHALEALCARLTACGRVAEAVDAGQAAVAAEPLRESAHRVLIAAHLAEGNHGEARRQFALCRALLRDELGLAPSPDLASYADGHSPVDKPAANSRTA